MKTSEIFSVKALLLNHRFTDLLNWALLSNIWLWLKGLPRSVNQVNRRVDLPWKKNRITNERERYIILFLVLDNNYNISRNLASFRKIFHAGVENPDFYNGQQYCKIFPPTSKAVCAIIADAHLQSIFTQFSGFYLRYAGLHVAIFDPISREGLNLPTTTLVIIIEGLNLPTMTLVIFMEGLNLPTTTVFKLSNKLFSWKVLIFQQRQSFTILVNLMKARWKPNRFKPKYPPPPNGPPQVSQVRTSFFLGIPSPSMISSNLPSQLQY